MLQTDSMPGITGEFETIDFAKHLSPQGKIFFQNSLLALNHKMNAGLNKKFQQTTMNGLLTEMQAECGACLQDALVYDYDVGPVAVIQSVYHGNYINEALKFLEEEKSHRDCALYRRLRKKKVEPLHLQGLPVEFSSLTEESKAVEDRLATRAIADIFTLYRIAQFDLLNPVEAKMLLYKIKSDAEQIPEAMMGFGHTAVRTENDGYDLDTLDEQKDTISDCVTHQASMLLETYRHFSPSQLPACNAVDFIAAQKVLQSFEHVQILLMMSLEDNCRYVDAAEDIDHLYQSYVPAQEIAAYYAAAGENARLLKVPAAGSIHCDMFRHDDFTRHGYKAEMNEHGRLEFDRLLQSEFNRAAEQHCLPVVQVSDLREMSSRYRHLRF